MTDRIDLGREADFGLGPLLVRPSIRQIESGGASETLEPRIMQVLVALARLPGQVVSRDELIEACWEGRVVGDDALNRCVAKIRKTGETSGATRLETIPRVGYRMHVAETGAASPGVAEAPPQPVQRKWLVPIAAVAGLSDCSRRGWRRRGPTRTSSMCSNGSVFSTIGARRRTGLTSAKAATRHPRQKCARG